MAAPKTPRRIDDKDRAILRVLQRRADAPATEIARAAGLSQTPSWRRVGLLERSGIIRKRVALLDGEALGFGVVVFAEVAMKRTDARALQAFERSVQGIAQIVECHAVSGERDFVLKIVVDSVASYERLLRGRLLRLPGVGSISSRFALSTVKYSTEIPI